MVEGSRGSDAARLEARQADEARQEKLDKVPNGGVIVMVAPPNPSRCPPGPYERASMFAMC